MKVDAVATKLSGLLFGPLSIMQFESTHKFAQDAHIKHAHNETASFFRGLCHANSYILSLGDFARQFVQLCSC